MIACVLATVFAVRPARAEGAGCAVVADAMRRLNTTPYHQYITVPGAASSMEMFYSGAAFYLLTNGHWHLSPVSPAEMRQRMQDRTRNAKDTCRAIGDKTIAGEAMALYSWVNDGKHGGAESEMWISKATGLPLRQIIKRRSGGEPGSDEVTIRFVYDSVTDLPGD